MKKILYVGYRDNRHSSAGGYDKIVNHPNSDYISDLDVPFKGIKIESKFKFFNLILLELYSRIISQKYQIVHYFYGDTLKIPFKTKRDNIIIATIHLNLERKKRLKKHFLNILKSLDAVIVLSSNQQKQLREKYNIPAYFIPHGFDLPHFQYKNMHLNSGKINIFFSGTNYRDYNTFFESAKHCHHHNLNIIFHVVGQSSSTKNRLKQYSNVICYQRLDNNEYFSLLSSCDYNYLPLTFATANNALLEAEFLGVSSILPQIAGIEDYAAPAPFNIFYNNLTDVLRIFNSLKKNDINKDLINFSSKFLWDNIYQELNNLYNSLTK